MRESGPGGLECGVRYLELARLGLNGAGLRRLDEAVEKGGDLGPALSTRSVAVLVTDDHAAEPTPGGVTVQRDACVVEEARST